MCTWVQYQWRPEDGAGELGADIFVVGNLPTSVGAEKPTWVLYKSGTLLTAEPSLHSPDKEFKLRQEHQSLLRPDLIDPWRFACETLAFAVAKHSILPTLPSPSTSPSPSSLSPLPSEVGLCKVMR